MADQPRSEQVENPIDNTDADVAAAEEKIDQAVVDMMASGDALDMADELQDEAMVDAMSAASDLTRAVDAEVIADRLATLSGVVANAGVNDVEQGAALIAASEDVEAVSAAVGLMTVDDLDKGLELGRLAGELQILGRIVAELEMPVLSAVLSDRGNRLSELAKETILRAAASRSLTELIEATGNRIGDLGVNEIDEGILRVAASDIAASRSADLSAAGLSLGMRGVVELGMAAENADLADVIGEMGIEGLAESTAELADAIDNLDDDLDDGLDADLDRDTDDDTNDSTDDATDDAGDGKE